MPRTRSLPPHIWTRPAFIDCAPMTRLLFMGLWNFADDFGVQPLCARTTRLQVFPGDALDNDAVRAMLDELVARGLVRLYEVDGMAYVAIADWVLLQRVHRRARRRYPDDPSRPPPVVPVPPQPMVEAPPAAASPTAPAPAPTPTPAALLAATETVVTLDPSVPPETARWRRIIARTLHRFLLNGAPGDTEEWIDRWMADGCDLQCDVLPAISVACRPVPGLVPPTTMAAVAPYAEANRVRRLTCAQGIDAAA